jgi:uncharacterized membrane protein YccC
MAFLPREQITNIAVPSSAHWKLAVRYTVAAGLTFAVAGYFNLPQGYWSVVTAIAVMQGSVGGTLVAGTDRMLATVLGATVGAAFAALRQFTTCPEIILLCGAIAPLGLAAAMKPNLRVAPLTAAIIVLASPSDVTPLVSAMHRIIEIVIGSFIGIAVSLFVFPARAHDMFGQQAAKALARLAELFSLYIAGARAAADRNAIERLNDQIRATITAAENAAAESQREHSTRLADEPVPQSLVRVLRRLRSDVIIVGRILRSPLPDAVIAQVGPALDQLAQAVERVLQSAALSFSGRQPVPDLAEFDVAQEALRGAIERLQSDPASVANTEGASRLLALPFIIENLRNGLADLLVALAAFTRET